jgi:hypothetical protein
MWQPLSSAPANLFQICVLQSSLKSWLITFFYYVVLLYKYQPLGLGFLFHGVWAAHGGWFLEFTIEGLFFWILSLLVMDAFECPPGFELGCSSCYVNSRAPSLLPRNIIIWLVTNCRSGFATLPSVPLQEQPAVVLLLEGVVVSLSLALGECGGHGD